MLKISLAVKTEIMGTSVHSVYVYLYFSSSEIVEKNYSNSLPLPKLISRKQLYLYNLLSAYTTYNVLFRMLENVVWVLWGHLDFPNDLEGAKGRGD